MERVRALTDQLEAGITNLFQSGQYAAYLQSLSKLHHYSYGNIFLIKLQCPHASMVAGYGDWKRKFGRHVKAGETGITILAPCPYWARDEVEETGPDGQTIREQKWVKKTGFTTATVFDVRLKIPLPRPHQRGPPATGRPWGVPPRGTEDHPQPRHERGPDHQNAGP